MLSDIFWKSAFDTYWSGKGICKSISVISAFLIFALIDGVSILFLENGNNRSRSRLTTETSESEAEATQCVIRGQQIVVYFHGYYHIFTVKDKERHLQYFLPHVQIQHGRLWIPWYHLYLGLLFCTWFGPYHSTGLINLSHNRSSTSCIFTHMYLPCVI